MNLDTDSLRRLYSQSYGKFRGGTECPTSEALSAAAQGPVSPELALHLERCLPCAEAYQLAFTLFRELTPSDPKHEAPQRNLTQWKVVLLAACFGVVAFTIPWMMNSPLPLDQHRGVTEEWQGMVPEDGVLLDQSPDDLVWIARYSDESYRVEVFDEELTPLWVSELLEEPRADLPTEISDGMAPGGLYFWQVTYFNRGQKAKTPLMAFTLKKD